MPDQIGFFKYIKDAVTGNLFTVDETATLTSKAPTANPTFTGLITTGGAVGFPAVQAASSDPNTLDDYEEGTQVVTMVCGTSGTITLNASHNTIGYIKIGKLVMLSGRLIVDSVSSPVGLLTISALPFTSGAGTEGSNFCAIPIWADNMESGANFIQGRIASNATVIGVYSFAAGAASSSAAALCKAGTEIYIGGSYIASA